MMIMMAEEERVLVDRLQRGEDLAFQDFVEQYKQPVYFLALNLTGNHHDAEDLSQDVFLKVFGAIQGFRGEAKVSSWLHRITVNLYINRQRKAAFRIMKRQEDFEEVQRDLASSADDPQKELENKRLQQEIERAMTTLSPQQKSVFVLRHYQNMKLKEIAHALDVTEGTVKSVLFRAIQKLQQALSAYRLQME